MLLLHVEFSVHDGVLLFMFIVCNHESRGSVSSVSTTCQACHMQYNQMKRRDEDGTEGTKRGIMQGPRVVVSSVSSAHDEFSVLLRYIMMPTVNNNVLLVEHYMTR